MFGAAALMFAACSSDEAVKVNKGEEIAFRANINWTRGHDMNIGNLDKFSATAINPSSNSTNPFFENAIFEKEGNTYVCKAAKYYWPETDALNFFAYAPVDDSQIVRKDYKTFEVTPGTNVNAQADLIYANTNNKTKASNVGGVALNFRHTQSKVAVKVYNSNNFVSVTASAWKIGYLSPKGTFTYQDATTDGKNDGTSTSLLLNPADWAIEAASIATEYEVGGSNVDFPNVVPAANAASMVGEMILIPQQLNPFTEYDINSTDPIAKDKPNGAYIAVKLRITNKADGTLLYGGQDGEWAIWPVGTTWVPGKKYTYVIDLGDGGYTPGPGPDPNNPDPNPVLNPNKE